MPGREGDRVPDLTPAGPRVEAAGDRLAGPAKRLRWRRHTAGAVKGVEDVLAWQRTAIDELKPTSDDRRGATHARRQDPSATPASPARTCHLIKRPAGLSGSELNGSGLRASENSTTCILIDQADDTQPGVRFVLNSAACSAMLAVMRARVGLAVTVLLAGLAISVAPAPAPSFVMVSSREGMAVYSSVTGARVRTLHTFSSNAFTNNGLAYAPNGSAVYFTLIPRHHTGHFFLRLMRLDVASGRQTVVGDGAQPALSSNGEQLAYGAFPQGLAVRDLRTGRTRTVAMNMLGKSADLENASIHWLGDGSTVAILPAAAGWDLMGKPPRLRWCGTLQRHPVVVFVHVPAPPAPLAATCVHLSGVSVTGGDALGADPGSPDALLAAGIARGGGTVVERITETGKLTPLLRIPDSLPLAFDPSGSHLLYLAGHKKPTLTEATIIDGQLIPGSWRERVNLGALAW